MSKTIIAVRHFGLGGRESLETAVTDKHTQKIYLSCLYFLSRLSSLYFLRTRTERYRTIAI